MLPSAERVVSTAQEVSRVPRDGLVATALVPLAAGSRTSMICKPLEPSATKAVLPSEERQTPVAKPVVLRVPVSEGLAGLLMSMICNPLKPSVTKAVLPSAESVTPLA